MIPLITIEGATASGKSRLALEAALELGGEIISADSRQVYKFMDIGTAKPSRKDRQAVPHHLIDIISPDQTYNAGQFVKDAARQITALHQQGKIPIVCGGTGLYIRSLLEGLFELPELPGEIRAELKCQLQEKGLASLYSELKNIDPKFAAKISDNDPQRTLRGLEVALATGKTITHHWQQQQRMMNYLPYKIVVSQPRKQLYERINSRVNEMLEQGLIDEIAKLRDLGYTELSPGLNSLGYKEFLPLFAGTATLPECTVLAAQHHRNYAKRQLTWYRKCTFDLTYDPNEVTISEIIKRIKVGFSEACDANSSQSN